MHPLLFRIPLGPTRLAWFGHELVLGPLDVPAYGALLAVGFVMGAAATWRRAATMGLAREALATALAAGFFAGLIGARLGFVVLHPRAFESVGAALSLRSGGLVGLVGLATGAGAAAWVARARGVSAAALFDAAAPSFGLGVTLTRLGCFLEGCDFGRPLAATAPRWLARLGTFPAGSPAWVEHVSAGTLGPNASASLPVHPSELYECIAGLALVGLALVLGRRSRATGDVAIAVAGAYLALRLLVDLSRPAGAEVWCVRVVALVALAVSAPRLVRRARARHP
jgi:phosphatidylglycerol---prolipoprotein diacylglyceryl transferase